MKETGRVIENNNKTAVVRVLRQSTCSKCDKNCSLAGQDHEKEEMDIEVDNPVGAEAGNVVKLEMGSKSLVLASLIVYILPLLFLIGGYFIGFLIASKITYFSREIISIFSSIFFLALSFGVIRLLDNRLKSIESFHPRIIEIVE